MTSDLFELRRRSKWDPGRTHTSGSSLQTASVVCNSRQTSHSLPRQPRPTLRRQRCLTRDIIVVYMWRHVLLLWLQVRTNCHGFRLAFLSIVNSSSRHYRIRSMESWRRHSAWSRTKTTSYKWRHSAKISVGHSINYSPNKMQYSSYVVLCDFIFYQGARFWRNGWRLQTDKWRQTSGRLLMKLSKSATTLSSLNSYSTKFVGTFIEC